MQRRVLFLRSRGESAQRNRVAELSRIFHEKGWGCSDAETPCLARYDIVWVVDPIHTRVIPQYRLLVWDDTIAMDVELGDTERQDGAMILEQCANLILRRDGSHEFDLRDLKIDGLDGVLAQEIAEDVLDYLEG